MLAFSLRILSGIEFLELSGVFPVKSQVCFYEELIFPWGQMRPCPFSDLALGHQWCAGSSRKGVAASEAQASGPPPSVQCCRRHCFPCCLSHEGLGGLGPHFSLLFFWSSCIIGCKTFTCRWKLIFATINSHCNSFRNCSLSINGKVDSSIKQPG